MRKKEYMCKYKKCLSNDNILMRYMDVSGLIRYGLRRSYADVAIDYFERLDKNLDEYQPVPKELYDAYLEAGKYYEKTNKYDEALYTLRKAFKFMSVNNEFHDKFQKEFELIELKRKIDEGKAGEKDLEEISDYDLFKSYFGGKIPVKEISEEIFPDEMKKTTNNNQGSTTTKQDKDDKESKDNSYDESLSAVNRLNFLMDNFKISGVRIGHGKFKGAMIFEIENSDIVIVENFWRNGADGEIYEDYGKATYMFSKDQAMDLIKLSKGKIKAIDGLKMNRVNHSKGYYSNLMDRYSALEKELDANKDLDDPDTDVIEEQDVVDTDKSDKEERKLGETTKSEDAIPVDKNEDKAEEDRVEEKKKYINADKGQDAEEVESNQEPEPRIEDAVAHLVERYNGLKEELKEYDEKIAEADKLEAEILGKLQEVQERKAALYTGKQEVANKKEKIDGILFGNL